LPRVGRSSLALLFGAVAFIGVVAVTTPPGPGLDPDSMSYLGAAESVVLHGALRVPFADWSSADSTAPLSHFPPGFPLVLAAPVALGAPPVQAARAVEAVAAFATVGLAVWLVATAVGSGAATLAGVVLLVSPSLAFDHWQVLSEPLCLACLLATVAFMLFSDRPWTYGATAAAAALVRYAGAGAVVAAGLWAFGRRGSARRRVGRAALAAAPGIVLQAAWMLRGAFEGGEARHLAWQGALAPTMRDLGGTLGAWLAPLVPGGAAQVAVAVLAAGVAMAAIISAARELRRGADGAGGAGDTTVRRLLAAIGVMALGYAGIVLWSRLLVYDNIPFDQRILSPLVMLVELAVAVACGWLWRRWGSAARLAVGTAWCVWLATSAVATVRAVADARDGGWGYASDEWRASGLARWLRTEGSTAAIFSNNPATAYALTHRPSRNLPRTDDRDSLAAFAGVFRGGSGILVRFPFDLEPGAPPDTIARRLGLRVLARFPDGEVWGAVPPAESGREPGR
jgi:hypothetical protein